MNSVFYRALCSLCKEPLCMLLMLEPAGGALLSATTDKPQADQRICQPCLQAPLKLVVTRRNYLTVRLRLAVLHSLFQASVCLSEAAVQPLITAHLHLSQPTTCLLNASHTQPAMRSCCH